MSLSTSPTPLARQPEKPVMVLKPPEVGPRSASAPSSLPSIPVATTQGEAPLPGYHLQRPPASQQHGDGKILITLRKLMRRGPGPCLQAQVSLVYQ